MMYSHTYLHTIKQAIDQHDVGRVIANLLGALLTSSRWALPGYIVVVTSCSL